MALQRGRKNNQSRSSERLPLSRLHVWLGSLLRMQHYNKATRGRDDAFSFIRIMHKNFELVFFVGKHLKSPIKISTLLFIVKEQKK